MAAIWSACFHQSVLFSPDFTYRHFAGLYVRWANGAWVFRFLDVPGSVRCNVSVLFANVSYIVRSGGHAV
ncbi:hypothetical protein D1872_269720 [compost metagenome]